MIFKTVDIFLAHGIEKGGLKMIGSHTHGSTRKYYLKSGFAQPKQPLHHWLIENNSKFGKSVPDIIKNQMWNYKPFASEAAHTIFGHGKNFMGQPGANLFGQLWHGTPAWPKLFTLSYGGRGFSAMFGGDY
jgi:hypothetical protein